MPFTDHRGLVAGLFQEFGKGLLVAIKAISVCHKSVDMAVFSSQNDGSTRATDRIGTEAVLKQHALGGDFVDVGSWVDVLHPTLVSPDGMRGMVVGEDE